MMECVMARDARLSVGSMVIMKIRRKSYIRDGNLSLPMRLLRRYTHGSTGVLKVVMPRSM